MDEQTQSLLMQRCFELARLGRGQVSPNPMVGALIWHQGRILGEGYHKQYGQAHAEVEAFQSVHRKDRSKLAEATLFVSLEPCCIHHNTPACTDLIRRERFKRVVVSVRDPHPQVNGHGLKILREAGIEVIEGVLAEEGKRLIAPQLTYYTQKRPYVILKYAQSANGYLGSNKERILITGALSQRLVHRWRSESDALLTGSGTALTDDPQLTNRLWFGKSPIRILLDRRGRVQLHARLFDDSTPTLVFGRKAPTPSSFQQTQFLPYPQNGLPELLQQLATLHGIRLLLVEAGNTLLHHFLQTDLWDEIRRGSSPNNIRTKSSDELLLPAPQLPASAQLVHQFTVGSDRWEIFRRIR